MKCRTITYTITLFLSLSVFSFSVSGQTETDLEVAMGMMDRVPEKTKYNFAKNNKNELQMLFAGLFLGYKSLISSQDGASCTFTPSCSEYGMLAIKKRGTVVGIISTFDRLSRCNGLSPEKYAKDPKTQLFIDPVD